MKDYGKCSNYRDIKLVTTNEKRNKYVSEPNFISSKCSSERLMAIELNKTKVLMNKLVYLGQVILDLSETLMYEFYYGCIKLMYKNNVKLCYMDTDSFILYIQTEDFYKDISNDINKWFDTSVYKNNNRPLKIGINKKVIGNFKDELNDDIMIKFCATKAKTYSFLTDKNKEIKKAKGTKKCLIKNKFTFKNYEESVQGNKTIIKSQLRFKSDNHIVYTEEINKIAISPNDDKRIQSFDDITTYPYGINNFELCEYKNKPIALYY